MNAEHAATGKTALRQAVLARRRARGMDGSAATSLLPLLAGRRTVASYLPLRDEPDTAALHAACADRGIEVAVPRLRPDLDLDLVLWTPGVAVVAGPRGTSAPAGPDVGWAWADLVVVPALAVDRCGVRLGHGGGSYDRALARVRPGVPVMALLCSPDELYDALPREDHDVAVSAVAFPGGLVTVAGPAEEAERLPRC